MNNIPKIMFAISDTGGGHRSAAQAMIAALDRVYEVQCTISDFLRVTSFPGLKQAPEIYDYCSRNHLWLNNLFFRNTNSVSRIKALTRMVYVPSRHRIERALAESRPDAVIAVHPLVIGLLRLTRDMLGATWPIITVVTDPITIHASWATPGADLYLVATQEAVDSMVKYGIPQSRIICTGFPIHPKFVDNGLVKQQARQELGIRDQFTVLLTGGGVGAGNMSEWVAALERKCQDKQILVVTGRNQQLYEELIERKKHSTGLHIYGFVSNMEMLMSASDVIVSKAGPGTLWEGVAMKRPLLVTEAVGIQETGNIDYIQKNHFGHYCPTPAEACRRINELSEKPLVNEKIYADGAIVTNGSMRIADIIIRQMMEVTAARGQRSRQYGNSLRGA